MHQVCFMLMGASADAQFHAHTDPMCMILQSHWSISCALFPASLVLCINFIEQQKKSRECSMYRAISLWEPEPERPACVTQSNNRCWATAREELLKLQTTTPVIVLRKSAHYVKKKADSVLHSWDNSDSITVCRHLRRRCNSDISGVTGNQWNILTLTLTLNL